MAIKKVKNKRDWSEINGRKGKRYVETEADKKAKKNAEHRAAGRRPEKKGYQENRNERRNDYRNDYRNDFDREEYVENPNMIIGRNPVMEALKNDRTVDKLIVTKGGEGSIVKIVAMARDKGIVIHQGDKVALDRIAGGRPHQGVIAYVSPYEYSEMDDIFKKAEEQGEEPFIIILDNLEDPHNLGAIMRSAECAGAHGIIIPKRHSCGITEVVAKASAGAVEYMPCVKVTNIAQTIEELKSKGIWVAACDMGETPYYKQDLKGKIAIVIGSEGFGISKLVREKCDFVVSMPMKGKITSLNASNAAAILMYEVRRQRDAQ